MKTSTASFVAGLGLLLAARCANAMTIVRAGQGEAVIVIPQGNKATEAVDLQKYVERVSGAKLEIVSEDRLRDTKTGARLFVGPCRAASRVVDLTGLPPEGFVIKTDGQDLLPVYQRLGSRVKISTGHAFAGWWERYHERYPDIFAMQPNSKRIRICMCTRNQT